MAALAVASGWAIVEVDPAHPCDPVGMTATDGRASNMVAFLVPLGLSVVWAVMSWWRSRRRHPDPLTRQARAFAALRDIAQHPNAPTHLVEHPAEMIGN